LTAEEGYAFADGVGTWTGEANEVVFTVPSKEEAGTGNTSPQARIQEIKVTYAAGEVEEEEEETEEVLTISGMFTEDLTATIETADGYDYFVIEGGQPAGTSSYGDYVIYGLFYYEGDDQYEAGWYYDDIYGYVLEDGSIAMYPWLVRVLTSGQYTG
jgi:hypothetical protein